MAFAVSKWRGGVQVLAGVEEGDAAVLVVEGLKAHHALRHPLQCLRRSAQPRTALPHRLLLLLSGWAKQGVTQTGACR